MLNAHPRTKWLSKGNVQAEELRGQLGERLYGAFNLAAKAMNTSTKGLNDMLKKGEVLASDLLPKLSPLIKDLANNNGALEKQLESTRVAQNRLVLDMQDSADKIFQSGFSEGLKELYSELSTQLTETGKAQEDIGNIYKRFFQLLTLGVKAVVPLLQSLIHSLSFIADTAALSAQGWREIYDALERVNPALGKTAAVGSAIGLAFTSVFGKIMLVIGAVEELAALFDDKLVGAMEERLGYQVNLSTGMATNLINKDGKLFSGESRKLGLNEAGDIAGMVGGGAAATAGGLFVAKKMNEFFGKGGSWFGKTKALIAATHLNTQAINRNTLSQGGSIGDKGKKTKSKLNPALLALSPYLLATGLKGSSGGQEQLDFNIAKAKKELDSLRLGTEGSFTDTQKAMKLMEDIDRMERHKGYFNYSKPLLTDAEIKARQMLPSNSLPVNTKVGGNTIQITPQYMIDIQGAADTMDKQAIEQAVREINNKTTQNLANELKPYLGVGG